VNVKPQQSMSDDYQSGKTFSFDATTKFIRVFLVDSIYSLISDLYFVVVVLL